MRWRVVRFLACLLTGALTLYGATTRNEVVLREYEVVEEGTVSNWTTSDLGLLTCSIQVTRPGGPLYDDSGAKRPVSFVRYRTRSVSLDEHNALGVPSAWSGVETAYLVPECRVESYTVAKTLKGRGWVALGSRDSLEGRGFAVEATYAFDWGAEYHRVRGVGRGPVVTGTWVKQDGVEATPGSSIAGLAGPRPGGNRVVFSVNVEGTSPSTNRWWFEGRQILPRTPGKFDEIDYLAGRTPLDRVFVGWDTNGVAIVREVLEVRVEPRNYGTYRFEIENAYGRTSHEFKLSGASAEIEFAPFVVKEIETWFPRSRAVSAVFASLALQDSIVTRLLRDGRPIAEEDSRTPGGELVPGTYVMEASNAYGTVRSAPWTVPRYASGRLWHDLNGDGREDPGEPGVQGLAVFLDLDGDGSIDFGEEPLAVSDPEGHFEFGVPIAGEFKNWRIKPPTGTVRVQVDEFVLPFIERVTTGEGGGVPVALPSDTIRLGVVAPVLLPVGGCGEPSLQREDSAHEFGGILHWDVFTPTTDPDPTHRLEPTLPAASPEWKAAGAVHIGPAVSGAGVPPPILLGAYGGESDGRWTTMWVARAVRWQTDSGELTSALKGDAATGWLRAAGIAPGLLPVKARSFVSALELRRVDGDWGQYPAPFRLRYGFRIHHELHFAAETGLSPLQCDKELELVVSWPLARRGVVIDWDPAQPGMTKPVETGRSLPGGVFPVIAIESPDGKPLAWTHARAGETSPVADVWNGGFAQAFDRIRWNDALLPARRVIGIPESVPTLLVEGMWVHENYVFGGCDLPRAIGWRQADVPDVVAQLTNFFARFEWSAIALPAPASPALRIGQVGGQWRLSWTEGVLQAAPTPIGPWADVPGAVSPHGIVAAGVGGFFRVRDP